MGRADGRQARNLVRHFRIYDHPAGIQPAHAVSDQMDLFRTGIIKVVFNSAFQQVRTIGGRRCKSEIGREDIPETVFLQMGSDTLKILKVSNEPSSGIFHSG